MAEVFLRGKRLKLESAQAIGRGGEAEVYDVGGEALKLFKPPDHPDHDALSDPAEVAAAKAAASRRLKEHQAKLPALMKLVPSLPPAIVVPEALATNKRGEVVGYAMRMLSGAEVLLRYGQRDFRQGIPNEAAIAILRNLHAAVDAAHSAGVVVGDFNDLNVLVSGLDASLIDADSMQFSSTLGRAEVRAVSGCAAKCTVTSGSLRKAAHARLIRGGATVWSGKLAMLRSGGVDEDSVEASMACDLAPDASADVRVGDAVESFRQFSCVTYTTTFVDPTRCDPKATAPTLVLPHTVDSDWYAFAVMVMQSLLYVGPYGGVAKGVPHARRPLQRVTVFDGSVRYPKPAVPLGVLPDDVLHHLRSVFVEDVRGTFPIALLERMRWTKCSACGAEHARSKCPNCDSVAPTAVKEVTMVRGQVTATRVFSAGGGRVLRAEAVGAKIAWLYIDEHGRLRREGGDEVGTLAQPDPRTRFRLRSVRDGVGTVQETVVAVGHVGLRLAAGRTPGRIDVDAGPVPMVDANAEHVFWSHGGVLYRDGDVGPVRVGNVLRGQTLFWVGPKFGFGFYRAGAVTVGFTFAAAAGSLNDSVAMTPVRGQLIDASVAFSDGWAWVFTSAKEGARIVNRCALLRAQGTVDGEAETDAGDGSWLGQIRGAAAGEARGTPYLLVPTDEGVLQVKPGHAVSGNAPIAVAKKFPDTEPFVDSGSKLLVGPDGLYVVTRKDVTKLAIS